jgi:hypothetical protein
VAACITRRRAEEVFVSCVEQNFTGFTPERFDCLLQKAQAVGIDITGNSGTASRDGIEIAWNFDPSAQTLTIQCIAAPLLVPCGLINSKIRTLVDSCA